VSLGGHDHQQASQRRVSDRDAPGLEPMIVGEGDRERIEQDGRRLIER
jgi:hypothetical protein